MNTDNSSRRSLGLSLIIAFLASLAMAEEPPAFMLMVEGEPQKAMAVQRKRAAEVSDKRSSKFRILPGISNPAYVSLEAVGAKDFFLRHANGIIHLHEKPKNNPVFNDDATWIITRLPGNKVRFESTNYRGEFMTALKDGRLIKMRDAPLTQSTFILKPAAS